MNKWVKKLFCPIIGRFCPYCNEAVIVNSQNIEVKEQDKENKGEKTK